MQGLQVLDRVAPAAWNAGVKKLNGCAFHTLEWGDFSAGWNGTRPLFFRWSRPGAEPYALGLGQLEQKKVAGLAVWTALFMGSLPAAVEGDGPVEAVKSLIEYSRMIGVGALEVHSFGTPRGTEFLKDHGFDIQRRWEFLVTLEGGEEELWKRIHSKKRNLIRKSEKEGLRVIRASESGDMQRFRDLARETYERKMRAGVSFPPPAPERYYALLKEKVIDTGLGRLYLAYDGDEAVGGAFFVGFNETAYYLLSSALEQGLRKAAPDLILWTAMVDYLREGCRIFNLGGLSERELEGGALEDSGLYHFKSRFSAEAAPCYRGTLTLRPARRKAYDLLRKTKSKLGWSRPSPSLS